MNNRLLIALSVLLGTSSAFAGESARSIMEKADARDDGASLISTMQMTFITTTIVIS